MNYKIITRILIAFLLFSFYSCGKEKKKQQKVIVRVAKDELTLEDLKRAIPLQDNKFLTHEQLQNYIQGWIEHELLYQEAINQGLSNSEELAIVLKKAKKDYLVDKLLDSLLTQKVSISEQEIINYYEMNKDNFMRAKPEIRALHILVSDEKEAKAVRRRLLKGEDFETVAREVSLDYQRRKRIDMGYFTPDDVVPEIAMYLFRWRVGSITKPIKSEFGYHIFKILDKKPRNTIREYDDVKDLIIKRLTAKKREELYKELLTNLKSKINIKTNFEYLKELFSDSSEIARNDSL